MKKTTIKLMKGLKTARLGYNWPEHVNRASRLATAQHHKKKRKQLGAKGYRQLITGAVW